MPAAKGKVFERHLTMIRRVASVFTQDDESLECALYIPVFSGT